MKITPKLEAIRIALIFIVLGAGVFGYIEIFTKGLDRLPAKVCEGAVDRKTAASALPDARKADERGVLRTDSRDDFTFYCYVSTQDSMISGEADTQDVNAAKWSEGFEGTESAHGKIIKVSAGNIKAISQTNRSQIYAPCTPPEKKKEKALQAYSLIVEARTIGDTRVTGAPLRQAITDFAYQLIKHTYKAGKCQEPQEFPDELPRLPTK